MDAIAFIVPTFNRAHFLGEALSAILRQVRYGDEIVVVDDGSTDDTAAVVAAAGPRVRYIAQSNSGKAAALNRALAATSAPLVWICDDDDVLRHGAVALLAEAMAEPGIGFAFGRYTRFSESNEGGRRDLGTGYWPDLSQGSLVRHILEDAFVMQNAALVRRSAYNAVGPFSEAMPRSLDYEMFVRLAVSQRSRYIDSILFDQRKHDGARGPAALLHAADRSDEIWQRYDRLIFLNLYRHAPIALFEGMIAADDAALRRRAALLLRACIMMRHGCSIEALNDLEAAAEATPAALDAGEAQICRRAFAGKHGFAPLLKQDDALRRLRSLSRSRLGHAIVAAMIDGTLWRLRHGQSNERSDALSLMWSVWGWKSMIAPLAIRLGHRDGSGAVSERDTDEIAMLLSPGHLPAVSSVSEAAAA